MKPRRILVPVDFSDGSLAALDYAAVLARDIDAEIVVLFVLEPVQFATSGDIYGTPVAVHGLMDEQRRAGRRSLDDLVAKIGKRGARVRGFVREGAPRHTIVDAAAETRADLIVMGTHGRSGMSRMLLGSVAEGVLRHAPCPVLTMRAPARPRRRRGARK